VTDWPSARRADTARFGRFFQAMLGQGVYLAPSQFEAGFTATVHDEQVIDQTVKAAREAFAAL
jgi:glutamate-1-semialdehyde 2,1-aminomutase